MPPDEIKPLEEVVVEQPKTEPETKPEAVVEAKPEAKAEVAAETKTEEVEATAEPKAAPAKPQEDWRDARIRQLSAKLAEARKKTEAVPTEAKPGEAPPAADEIERQVEVRAQAKASIDAFNKACGEAAAAGKAQFPDFDQRLGELIRLVDPADPASASAYNEFLVAALETGKAPEIIHALGGDLNEAARILSLPPIKRAVELTRLAEKEPAGAPDLPKPIKAIGGNKGATHTSIDPTDPTRADNLSTAAWMERRNAQLRERSARK